MDSVRPSERNRVVTYGTLLTQVPRVDDTPGLRLVTSISLLRVSHTQFTPKRSLQSERVLLLSIPFRLTLTDSFTKPNPNPTQTLKRVPRFGYFILRLYDTEEVYRRLALVKSISVSLFDPPLQDSSSFLLCPCAPRPRDVSPAVRHLGRLEGVKRRTLSLEVEWTRLPGEDRSHDAPLERNNSVTKSLIPRNRSSFP